ncbi:hypothetical protein NLG97_g11211 [Lecanicillium saksenae]|uniref:Uncharacterized protein n=1 Tax=Lecanicillium saksenae TaxID=468837 RepID=A0ACC1QE59_9HYPO|nr:hypothetical protein NLG97_g11211 [Lecanicillium saksenae]
MDGTGGCGISAGDDGGGGGGGRRGWVCETVEATWPPFATRREEGLGEFGPAEEVMMLMLMMLMLMMLMLIKYEECLFSRSGDARRLRLRGGCFFFGDEESDWTDCRGPGQAPPLMMSGRPVVDG